MNIIPEHLWSGRDRPARTLPPPPENITENRYIRWNRSVEDTCQAVELLCQNCEEFKPITEVAIHECCVPKPPDGSFMSGIMMCQKCIKIVASTVRKDDPLGCQMCNKFAKWYTWTRHHYTQKWILYHGYTFKGTLEWSDPRIEVTEDQLNEENPNVPEEVAMIMETPDWDFKKNPWWYAEYLRRQELAVFSKRTPYCDAQMEQDREYAWQRFREQGFKDKYTMWRTRIAI